MMGGNDVDLHRAKAMGVSLFAGEAEGRMELVLNDAYAKNLKPLYNFMADLPNIEGEPLPLIPAIRAARTAGEVTSFDAGRGCPFQCSFCTIINVQGRKSRRRSPDDVEKLIRENVAQGLNRFFITDDNFARNKDWEKILRSPTMKIWRCFTRLLRRHSSSRNSGGSMRTSTSTSMRR